MVDSHVLSHAVTCARLFLVPSNTEKFGFVFARAIHFNFKEHLRLSTWIESKMFGSPPEDGKTRSRLSLGKKTSLDLSTGKEASWERVMITFEKYAIDFKKRYGCVPVLIFDNCDSLAKKDKKMLEILQDIAKTAIDDSIWVTVFVGNVGEAPEQMEGTPDRIINFTLRSFSLGRSSITRASSFIEIPDLTEKEAMTYLTDRRNLSDDMAKKIYALFGGRLKSLQNVATKIESGVSFDSRFSLLSKNDQLVLLC